MRRLRWPLRRRERRKRFANSRSLSADAAKRMYASSLAPGRSSRPQQRTAQSRALSFGIITKVQEAVLESTRRGLERSNVERAERASGSLPGCTASCPHVEPERHFWLIYIANGEDS